MLEIEVYIQALLTLLKRNFGSRLLYVGLQGSYLRNEADEKSDIDIMVIIDGLSITDLELYRNILRQNGSSEKACGFICGRAELMNWNPCEICHLTHTTRDYYGALAEFVPPYTEKDEENYIKLSLNNLYHELCHGYVHASKQENMERLPGVCKAVFFILQNLNFQATGSFVQTKNELLSKLSGKDKKVLSKALELKNRNSYDFNEAYRLLFEWCRDAIIKA